MSLNAEFCAFLFGHRHTSDMSAKRRESRSEWHRFQGRRPEKEARGSPKAEGGEPGIKRHPIAHQRKQR